MSRRAAPAPRPGRARARRRAPTRSRSSGSGSAAPDLGPAEPVQAGVDHDPVQPGRDQGVPAEACPPGGTRRRTRPGARRRRRRAAHHAQRDGPEAVLVALDEGAERVRVAVDVGAQQVGVARGSGGSRTAGGACGAGPSSPRVTQRSRQHLCLVDPAPVAAPLLRQRGEVDQDEPGGDRVVGREGRRGAGTRTRRDTTPGLVRRSSGRGRGGRVVGGHPQLARRCRRRSAAA